ncbi:extended synaptotagmin-1 [Rhynochetos jubatus]
MERRGPGLAALGALGRRLLWALPAYAAGLLGLGAGALVLALALYAGWRRRRRSRENGLRLAARLQRDEEAAVRAAAAAGLGAARGELPAWVSFPDVERAEWLNKVLAQAWPFLGRYVEKLLVGSVAPAVRASSPHLQTFAFTRVDVGQKPLEERPEVPVPPNTSTAGELLRRWPRPRGPCWGAPPRPPLHRPLQGVGAGHHPHRQPAQALLPPALPRQPRHPLQHRPPGPQLDQPRRHHLHDLRVRGQAGGGGQRLPPLRGAGPRAAGARHRHLRHQGPAGHAPLSPGPPRTPPGGTPNDGGGQ